MHQTLLCFVVKDCIYYIPTRIALYSDVCRVLVNSFVIKFAADYRSFTHYGHGSSDCEVFSVIKPDPP